MADEMENRVESVRGPQVRYDLIPAPHMDGAVRRYIEQGIPPGSFMTAILSNNLKEAVFRADHMNKPNIVQWVEWFANHAPGACWGSEERVRAWVELHHQSRDNVVKIQAKAAI
jgi:hypothetical protein